MVTHRRNRDLEVTLNVLHYWKAGIAQRYSTRCTESRKGLGIFLFTTASRPALRPTQPPIQWVPGALSLGLKWPGCEAAPSTPCSTEVKNPWSYTSTPQYSRMAWCSVKAEGQLYLTLLHYWESGVAQWLDYELNERIMVLLSSIRTVNWLR
jgi:hypothetical protein